MKKICLTLFGFLFHIYMIAAVVVNTGSQNVTASTAELYADFTLSDGSFVSNIAFEYRKKGTSTYTSSSGFPGSLNDPGGRSGITAGGLDASTTYEFRVKYRANGSLIYTYSSLSEFITPAYDPAVVTTYDASNIAGTTADLNAEIEVGSQTPLLNVHFEWGDESATVGNYDNSTANQNISADDVLTEGISSLTVGTTYYFRIVATDESSGTALLVYGDEKSFVASAVPAITGFSNHLTDEFDIAWSFSGTASTYYLDIATDAAFTNMLAGYNNLNTGNVTSYNVSGCTAGTVYYARLRAGLNGGGTTGNSDSDNTITICDAPTATAASAIGVAQFTANWNTQTGASSYLLDVSLTNTFATFVGSYEDYEVIGGASLSQIVSGLSPSTDYYYRLRAKNSSGNSAYSNIIGPVTTLDVDEVEWDGSESTDWHTAANWEYNTLPSSTIGAIIPSAPANQPKITASTSCQYLTIEPGASVIIEGNRKKLTIADGDLIIQSNSSNTGEIAITGGSSISFTDGVAKFQQYIPGNRWNFVTVPMSGITSNDFYLNHNPDVYFSYYNEDQGGGFGGIAYCEACWSYIEPTNVSINIKQGYKMWIAGASQTFELSGSDFINGNQSITLASSGNWEDGYGWNFVGNPYPSHIDWKKASISALQNDGYYAWDGDQYIAYQGNLGINGASQYIPPFQGFFVRTATDNSSISFSNSARNVASSTLYKEDTVSVPDYIRIRINEITHKELTDELIVRFLENANEQYDKIGDAYKMYGNYEIPQIFTYIEDGTELSINALPPEMKDKAIVPLGIFVAMDGTFQFTATEMESFQHEIPIKVRDLETGDVFDLTENPVFEVELDSGYYLNRFEMLFGENTSIPDQLTLKNDLIRINSDNQYINIAVLGEDVQLPLTVEVFDVTGRLINKTLVNKTGTSRIYMQHNVKTCVTRLSGNNINKVQKLIIN